MEQVRLLVGCGLNQEQVSLVIGKSVDALHKNALTRAALADGKVVAVGKVGSGLITRAIAGDNVASIFYLKTQAGWSEKAPETPPTELTVRWAE
ncbi:hypothetical protein [Novosphingobium sp.]|uniref:hypothetical protein n=1 Tax=Novosphingobium sp. TaxID=1874826 RepID=UPI003D0E4B40